MHRWTVVAPVAAVALLVAAALLPASGALAAVSAIALVGAVLAAVHHAEVIAHKLGEPLGTLVLALAVTVIEVSLILSLMIAGGAGKAGLARDTVYATVMIIANGVIGLCVMLGGLRHREQLFRVEGAAPAFSALAALSTLVLVLPVFTTSVPGPFYTRSQLAFAGIASLVLWGVFTFVQTVRHRNYFLPPEGSSDENAPLAPPSTRAAWASLGLLMVSLVGVVGLAKVLSPSIEEAVRRAGAPEAVIGIAISLLVLMPETLAAVQAAHRNRLQTSMNLALGSALATIGLTIPAVVAVALALDLPVALGLPSKDIVLLGITLVVGVSTLGMGRTSIMQGAVQLVVFATYLFLSFVP